MLVSGRRLDRSWSEEDDLESSFSTLLLPQKTKEIRGRGYWREPETRPGVISHEIHVVHFSPAVLCPRETDFCRLKREHCSKLLHQSLESGCLEVASTVGSRTESNPGSGALTKPIVRREKNIFVWRRNFSKTRAQSGRQQESTVKHNRSSDPRSSARRLSYVSWKGIIVGAQQEQRCLVV